MHPDLVRAQLALILASRAFAHSDRLRRFLRFVVETTLAGQSDRIKEYAIGVEAYDRGEQFDPRADPVVRTEAARLREKLKAFYEGEGAASACAIELPKGGYVPLFRNREGAAAPSSPHSIAVLPFLNMSADPDTDYFADGLTEELIHALAHCDGLRVVARTTAFQFKGVAADVREIGTKLGAATVLEGSVRKGRDGVRITAQLISVSDGYHLWSGVFDRSVVDAILAQEEVARAVAAALQLPLTGKAGRITRAQSPNRDANDLYLRGRHGIRQFTAAGMQDGIARLHQAITLDPNYAVAYEALAETLALSLYFGVVPSQWVIAELKSAATRALDLDPTLTGAHVALAIARAVHDHDWNGCRESFRNALLYSRGDPATLNRYTFVALLPFGLVDEALDFSTQALALDPADPLLGLSHANVYFWMRRYDEALDHYCRALTLDPLYPQTWWNYAYGLAGAGKLTEAIHAYRRADTLTGEGVNPLLLGDMARVLAIAGETADAERLLAGLVDRSRHAWVPPLAMAWATLGLARYDAAFGWIDKAYESRQSFLIWCNVDPRYDAIRDDPRFGELRQRLGLGGRLPEPAACIKGESVHP